MLFVVATKPVQGADQQQLPGAQRLRASTESLLNRLCKTSKLERSRPEAALAEDHRRYKAVADQELSHEQQHLSKAITSPSNYVPYGFGALANT